MNKITHGKCLITVSRKIKFTVHIFLLRNNLLTTDTLQNIKALNLLKAVPEEAR